MRAVSIYFAFLCSLAGALAFVPTSPWLPPRTGASKNYPNSSVLFQRPAPALQVNHGGDNKNMGVRKSSAKDTKLLMLPAMAPSLPVLKQIGLAATAVIFVLNFRRILWPNSLPDKNVSAPLPPGSMGCPFFGHGAKVVLGTKSFGPGLFLHNIVKKFNSHIVKYYVLGKPFVALSDGEQVKDILTSEFEEDGVSNSILANGILGPESMLGETDRKEHSRLRRMVGQSMTPAAVNKSIPTLKAAAKAQIDIMLNSPKGVSGDEVCTRYTLDVAWRQILGLNLKDDEVPVFEKAVNNWLLGFTDVSTNLGFRFGFLPHWKALDYLKKKVGEKIDELEGKGRPDSSTLSGMVFAVDEEDSSRKLTRNQIIDNALILVLAGSETSASTLAAALLALKLNPHTWTKLVDEQKAMMKKYGDTLTRATLDEECPYLDAVIRETMRMKPLINGAPRILKETRVVDGYQLPKGWMVTWSPMLTHYNDPTTYKEDGSHMDLKKGFVPERWLEEQTRPSANFIPMGAGGPRYCLGSVLAYAEMKVFLAMVARNVDYKLLSSYDTVEWKKLSIIPKVLDGVPLIASKPAQVGTETTV